MVGVGIIRVEVGVGVVVWVGIGDGDRLGCAVCVGTKLGSTLSVCKALHPVIVKTSNNIPTNLHLRVTLITVAPCCLIFRGRK